jgi:hypothetical protein
MAGMMTDKPINEMLLSDYQRAIAAMERKRYRTPEPTSLREIIRQEFSGDVAKNGPMRQRVICVGEQGPDLLNPKTATKFDGPA